VPDVNGFELDARLAGDCLILGELDRSLLLLMNNALVPWFILVPVTKATEIYQLPEEYQLQLLKEIDLLSDFINSEFSHRKTQCCCDRQHRQTVACTHCRQAFIGLLLARRGVGRRAIRALFRCRDKAYQGVTEIQTQTAHQVM